MSIAALAALFGTSFLVSLTGALSPGPLTTAAVREGARRGFWAGPALAIGHGLIELVLVIGLVFGLSQVLDRDPVAASIAVAGGVFLLWLGVGAIRAAPRQDLPGAAPGSLPALATASRFSPNGAGALAALGVAMSVSNPFWLVWWATIGTAYIAKALDQGAAGVVGFYSGHVLADLGWLSLIALVLSTGRRIMSRRAYQGILVACGAALLGLGGWFLASAASYLT